GETIARAGSGGRAWYKGDFFGADTSEHGAGLAGVHAFQVSGANLNGRQTGSPGDYLARKNVFHADGFGHLHVGGMPEHLVQGTGLMDTTVDQDRHPISKRESLYPIVGDDDAG